MRTTTAAKTTPSQYQVREITTRGIPVPPTYAEAQALLDSFEPSDAQKRRMQEAGLVAATRGEAKGVIAAYVAAHPEAGARWEAEAAQSRVARRQAQRGGREPSVTTPGMFRLLSEAGAEAVPSDYATAAAMIDRLPPSDNMARVLREHGKAVPATRGEATEIISGLPATPEQIVTIMRRTGGRYAPRTRGEAERWFANDRRTRSTGTAAAEPAAA